MDSNYFWKIMTSLMLFALASCTVLPFSASVEPTQVRTSPAATGTSQVNLPNPASAYCEQQGNRLEIRTAADGSQSGVCVFPDGSECDEWAYFRGECAPTPPVTGSVVVPTHTALAPAWSVIQQSIPLPAGAIINPRKDTIESNKSMIFYNTEALTLGELLTPNAGEVHAAGPYQGLLTLPLVFQATEPDPQKQSIAINNGSTPADPGGQVTTLVSLPDQAMVSGLTGVPGEPVVFYIYFKPVPNAVRSAFVLSPVQSISTAAPLFTLESNESRYWKPVAIQIKDNAPSGLWFTRTPWGIGGDIVFPYYEGLSFYDLASSTIHEILPPAAQFNSLSTDQTWAVYSMHKEAGTEFLIKDLKGGEPIPMPTLPENDRGAGNGIFSPTNKYIAWREAQGSIADNSFKQTIRVATLDGQIAGQFPDTAFYKTAELNGEGLTIQPVAWLDDEHLLVQIIAMGKPFNGIVVKLNVPSAQFSLFAQGFFDGLFYP